MACRLSSAKPLPEPMLPYCQLDPREKKLQWNSNRNKTLFIHQNAFETVDCEMAATFSRGEELQYVSRWSAEDVMTSWYALVDPLVREIVTAGFPHKELVMRCVYFFPVSLKELLKLSSCRWFEIPWRSCNLTLAAHPLVYFSFNKFRSTW